MKKATILFTLFLAICQVLLADMPGNTPNQDTQLQLTGVKSLKGWTLYTVTGYGEGTPAKLAKDATFIIPGGRGAPQSVRVFARNKAGKQTQPLMFSNRDGGTLVVQLTGVAGDTAIEYTEIEKQQAPLLGDLATGPGSNSTEDWLLIAAAIGLVLLVGMYMRRKRMEQRGAGSKE